MRRVWMSTLVLIAIASITVSAGAEETGSFWFGLGGSSIGLYAPDLAQLTTFLDGAGFQALQSPVLVGGGRGRFGSSAGLSIGGVGWGGEIATKAGDLAAGLEFGFGGIELGSVVGGDERSFLTLGLVLGGGAASLWVQEEGEDSPMFGACGLVPEPTIRTAHWAFAGVVPFLSMQVQPLRFLGFEVHFGYMVPIYSMRCGLGDLAESVVFDASGPIVGLSFTWGWSGRSPMGRQLEETIEETVALTSGCVEVRNPIGSIEILGGASDEDEGAVPSGTVRVVAVKRARSPEVLEAMTVSIGPSDCGVEVATDLPSESWGTVEYAVSVPAGVTLAVEQGAGRIAILDHHGSVSIEAGVGDVEIRNVVGDDLSIEGGAGSVVLTNVEVGVAQIDVGIGGVVLVATSASEAQVEVGTGSIEMHLDPDASYAIAADVGLGEISIGPFGGERIEISGFAGEIETALGEGANRLELDVGIGSIDLRPL